MERRFNSEWNIFFHLSLLTLIHCHHLTIYFFNEIDLLVLEIIERVGFGVQNGLDIEIAEYLEFLIG